MYDLTAQVTSSLLPFPPVTVEALGEDEITLDTVLHGNFTVGRSGLAWLACGPHLEVVHAVTGERLSAYCFGDGGEHAPTVVAARDFSWLKRSGLLVGLEEAEGNLLCLYDLGLSRVVKAVVIPGRITAIEPVVSYGGASTLTQHLHQSLRWFFGIAAVVTDLGHVLLVDLCLDDLSCSQSELEASALQVVTKSPAEIPRLREVSTRQGRHLCLQLNAPSGVGATALQFIPRTNQLAVGFSNGNLQMWNMKTLKKEYHSQLEGGAVPVHAFTFQEPENDPRNCCYLWAVQSSQDLEGDTVSLHLLQLAFSERKCLSSGKILYEGLEYCEERYSQELSGTAFPLRAQTTNTRLLSCQTIEKFRAHPDRDDSMNEVASPDTSVSIFSWQVKAYGQATPSTYIGVFDINRWYHAQMPDSLRAGESLQNCPYLAVWSLDPVVQMVSPNILLDVVVHERSLSRGLPFTCPPPEQFFNPTTYNFDSTCLLNSGIVHLTCSGYQKETLSFLKKAAPCSSEIISSSYSRCLVSGLLSSRLADTQPSSLSQEEQLDAILSTAVETSSLGMITGCIKQWTAEEQPGSALNLRYILDWAWNKVVQTKEELDGICAPLFDSSSNFIDPQTLQLLQHCQRLLGNLSTIFHCLLNEAQELTQKGLVGLINKNLVSSLISKYAQVVLWFCRTGLLPEGSDEDALQISRPCYTHSVISNYYVIRREELTRLAKDKWCADCLMIDGLVGQCGELLTNLWKRDEGGTGQYPPPTLHALLDIYLLDNIDETTKHAIVIYLLLDVMHAFPDKDGASVHSFPSAFAIPVGLVKLVQGLWLLDHHGHQSSFELLLHPAASQCQFEWQHERVLNALMCQGQHSIALRYFHVTKPPISSTSQAKLCISILLHSRCLIEAWSLVRQHSNRLNMSELLGFLYESCQELGLIKELLKLPLGLSEQECLEKFLQGTGGLQNRELLMVHYLQQANYIPALQLNQSLKMNLVNERDPKLKERSNTRNSIMEQYGKVLPRVQRKLALERVKPYQHPCTLHREVTRPQPLSAVTKRSANDKVMSRAGFISNVLTKIEEVWLGKGGTPQSSPVNKADIQSPSFRSPSSALPDPFLGTPITMTSRRKSRLMDLVVQPSCQTPQPLLSPPRPLSSWMSPKSLSKAPELGLLQTPQVVKRARALAASSTVFSAFTPQSILRSSLRPTPVATPSASPGRSITPPLRSKESRITFIEEGETAEAEKGPIRWTNGIAADSEISLLTTRGSTLSKATCKSWSSQPADEDVDEEREQPHVKFLPPEGGIPSPELRGSDSESSSIHEVAVKTKPSDSAPVPICLSFDISQTSVQSPDTTLEFFDAPLSQEDVHVDAEDDDDVVTLNVKTLTENVESLPPATVEPPLLTPEIIEKDEEEAQEVVEELMEAEASKDVPEISPEEEANHEDVPSEHEPVSVSSRIDEEAADSDEEETPSQDSDQIMEILNSGTECADEASDAPEDSVLSHVTESAEVPEHQELSEVTEETNKPEEEELEQSADLTEFVQQHLFGSDLSPPLTRSGIHDTSRSQNSPDGESLEAVAAKEEAQAAVEPPTVFSSQKSNASAASSEPTGSDSHSVVSVNDSVELSSAESEEEEDEEEEEEEESDEAEEEDGEEEEEEDSGSEVEIIEEVQGNGRLPPLQPSSVFLQEQEHTHFLPSLTEQEAAAFSLITPGADMNIVDEDIEGDVVMVRLGNDEGEMEEQGSSYMELKPSTTLLVPLELVEGQPDLVDGAHLEPPEIQEALTPDDPETEAHCRFSLMLDVDEDVDKEVDTLENDLQSSSPPAQVPAEEAGEELGVKHEVILLSAYDQDAPPAGDVAEEEQRTEMDRPEVNEVDGPSEGHELQTDQQAEDTETRKGADTTESVISAEDFCPASLQNFPTLDYTDTDMAYTADEEEMDSPPAPEELEENGPVDTVTDSVPTAETFEYCAGELLQDYNTAETEEQVEDMRPLETEEVGQETAASEEQVEDGSSSQSDEQAAKMDEELVLNNGPADADVQGEDNRPSETNEALRDIAAVETDDQDEDTRPLETEEQGLYKMAAETDVQFEDNGPLETEEELQDNVDAETGEQREDIRALETEEQDLENRVVEREEELQDKGVVETDRQVEDNRSLGTEEEPGLDNGPAETDMQGEDIRPSEAEGQDLDTKALEMEEQQDDVRPLETEEQLQDTKTVETEEIPDEQKIKRRGRPRKGKNSEETPVKQVSSSNSELEEEMTPSSQKKAPATPTRRTTRARRTVTFISPLQEEPEEDPKETEVKEGPVTPRRTRTPRKTPVQASPTRRSARKAQLELLKEETDAADDAATTKTSEQTTTTSSDQKTQTGGEEVSGAAEPESKEEEQEVATQKGRRTRTPSKRSSSGSSSSTQGAAVRTRSGRRTLSSASQVESSTPEVLEEVDEHEEVFAPPVKRSSRKMKTEPQPEPLEVEDKMEEEEKKEVKQQQQQPPPSPGRTTRRASQNSLNMYPLSVKKTRQGTKTENAPEPEQNSVSGRSPSRRTARGKLWDHPEEELPLLDSPLEVDSETPVADALIKRLQDEGKQEGGVVVSKIVRGGKRSTKTSVELADMLVPEPAEDESSPGENSIIYSPSRRRTRSRRAESAEPTEESAAPATRSRRRGKEVSPQAAAASEEEHVEEEKTSTSRKTSRQTAKSKGASEPPAAVEVGVISPLPSPTLPLPRAQRRGKAGEVATSGMNLRRKRIMETVFTKPVTRRKKL